MSQKRLLIIARDYPPHGITSSRRPGGMVKYLPNFGWDTLVLCNRWTKNNCYYDPAFVPNLPAKKVYSIDIPPCSRFSVDGIQQSINKFIRPGLHPFGFVKYGKKTVDEIVKNEHFDAILATAPQGNVFELARYASKLSGKPWVADFRDVWQWIPNFKARIMMPLILGHEQKILREAAMITAVSKGFAATLAQRHNRKVEVISHGFDDELIAEHDSQILPSFNIVYTGSTTLGNPNLRPLLDAVGNLISAGLMSAADISIEFYGKGNEARLQQLFGDHKYAELVKDYGAVSREAVIKCQRNAAVLLVGSHPGMPGWVTSKMFEYIISGRPILSIPRDFDEVDALLKETNAGVSCDSVEEIEAALLKLYREWKLSGRTEYRGDIQKIMQYSTKAQTRLLAQKLDGLLEVLRGVH